MSVETREIRAATDGSILVNPDGPGGWAVIFEDGSALWGSDPSTTNNRMELQAVIEALRAVEESSRLTIECDSQYVCKGISIWLAGWKRRGWKNGYGGPIKNQDLWEEIDRQVARHVEVTMRWVRGHNGHVRNELADQYAGEAARGLR